MKIRIEQIDESEPEEVVVRCHDPKDVPDTLVGTLTASLEGLAATKDGEIYRIKLADIFWFEVVENRSFIYSQSDVYECKLKLYEFERLTHGTAFFRASKSTVINADKIESVSPTFSGRFVVKFINGERGEVSRSYVSALKKVMGLL